MAAGSQGVALRVGGGVLPRLRQQLAACPWRRRRVLLIASLRVASIVFWRMPLPVACSIRADAPSIACGAPLPATSVGHLPASFAGNLLLGDQTPFAGKGRPEFRSQMHGFGTS